MLERCCLTERQPGRRIARRDRNGRDRRIEKQPTSPAISTDPAERLTAEEADDAVAAALRERLAASSGPSAGSRKAPSASRSGAGAPIPDARLEADPAAELTLEEEQEEGTDLTAGDRKWSPCKAGSNSNALGEMAHRTIPKKRAC